ncbi:MAG: TAXI family TRAP transporter solute-binding subunit [Burkholderiaceae bacterium]
MTSAYIYRRRWMLIHLPLALLAAGLGALLWWTLYPMPPSRLTISTALTDGAYQSHAQRYAEAFARHGVRLDILPSAGSADNLQRLQSDPPASDLALVQGGFGWSSATDESIGAPMVQTLANVDVEVLWLFTLDPPLASLEQLAGARVAAGPPGSGHRAMLQRLLRQMGVPLDALIWSELSGAAARDALLRGEVDAAFMVASPAAPGVQALLQNPQIHMAQLQRTLALSMHSNFLRNRLLTQDSLGPGQPPSDVAVLTTPTHLLAHHDLDPALKRLATAVAMEVHTGNGPFYLDGELPALRVSDFPTSPQAREVLSRGLDGLEALLPFWWAQILQRALVIGAPMLMLLFFGSSLLPALLRWRLERQVTRWYGELKFVENDLANNTIDVGGLEMNRIHGRLNAIENALVRVQVPSELVERWYALRQHIGFVRQQVVEFRGR